VAPSFIKSKKPLRGQFNTTVRTYEKFDNQSQDLTDKVLPNPKNIEQD